MKPLSGKQAVKHLTKDFGFEVTRQKGSHIMLRKRVSDRTLVTVVPDHKELAPGTMRAILQQTGISREEWEEVAG